MLGTLRWVVLGVALCSAGAWAQLSNPTVVTNRVVVAPTGVNDWTDVVVSCPAGLAAVSGGLDTKDFGVIEVTTLAPTFGGGPLAFEADGQRGPADGWYASVRNFDTVSRTVTASAVCVPSSGLLVVVASAAVTAGTSSAPGDGTAFAVCPTNYSAVGGGVDVNLPGSMKVSASAPIFNGQFLIERPAGQSGPPAGWAGSVRSEDRAGVIKVAATCTPVAGLVTVSTGPFSITAGQVAGLSATCPAGMVALSGGLDSNNVSRNVVAVSTPMFAANPQFPADRDPGTYGPARGWYGIYYNYGPGATTGAVGVVCAQSAQTPANAVLVYEFYNTTLKHYFRTSSAAEADGIDHGSAGPGWVRTGDNFFAYVAGSNSPGADVCRFYTFGANSHFYTAFADECAGLKSPSSGWVYEGLSFRIQLPAGSTCGAGTIPVYRLYNDRFAFRDSNHRFTTLASEIPGMQAQGWIYEGVAFCAIAV